MADLGLGNIPLSSLTGLFSKLLQIFKIVGWVAVVALGAYLFYLYVINNKKVYIWASRRGSHVLVKETRARKVKKGDVVEFRFVKYVSPMPPPPDKAIGRIGRFDVIHLIEKDNGDYEYATPEIMLGGKYSKYDEDKKGWGPAIDDPVVFRPIEQDMSQWRRLQHRENFERHKNQDRFDRLIQIGTQMAYIIIVFVICLIMFSRMKEIKSGLGSVAGAMNEAAGKWEAMTQTLDRVYIQKCNCELPMPTQLNESVVPDGGEPPI